MCEGNDAATLRLPYRLVDPYVALHCAGEESRQTNILLFGFGEEVSPYAPENGVTNGRRSGSLKAWKPCE
jgi:hypothetical protein